MFLECRDNVPNTPDSCKSPQQPLGLVFENRASQRDDALRDVDLDGPRVRDEAPELGAYALSQHHVVDTLLPERAAYPRGDANRALLHVLTGGVDTVAGEPPRMCELVGYQRATATAATGIEQKHHTSPHAEPGEQRDRIPHGRPPRLT
jgi:hypothetical protein